ncbi:Retrovirus-related Pol polyprotein from transposon RE1 [Vitis vinifera]|uniref:Retrovirus-related Pol polyprotein from transposon RE1 n=1 Tax=Vitis vinifera TaxID=29760 RepID=A0A438KCJ1_VITVI|nr:Retrovirus-related Pol polyprotein from transposon RE1 [Vitis vinifera]
MEEDRCTAKGLYTDDIQRLYKVASSIVNVRQQDMDLSTYIGQIASLKEEFLTVMPLTTDVGDQRTQIDKFFMVLTLIGLRPDLETVRDQILGSSSVPSLDDVFARLLLVTEVEANVLIAPIAISLATLVIGVISYMGGLPALPTWPSHLILSPQPPSSSTSQGISLTDSEYDDYLRYQATKSASVTSVAQTGNASACLTHTSSLGPWILDSGASDHISGWFAHPLPSTSHSDRSTGKTIGIGRESQGLYHLTSPSTPAVCISTDAPLLIHSRLGHPSLSKFQKMVLVFHLCRRLRIPHSLLFPDQPLYFLPPRVFGCTCFVHILTPGQDKLSAKATKCIFLGYSDFKRVIVVIPLRLIATFSPLIAFSPTSGLSSPSSCRFPPSLAEVPADSLPIPSASPAPALPPLLTYPLLFESTPEALSHPGWRQAMVDEMAALHSNDTWDLVVLPSGKSTVGCRWVYTVKVGPDGQVDRLKARLVAKGYTQVYGSDYGDTFSPVAKIASVSSIALHGCYAFLASLSCIYLVVYVDDIVITGSDQNGIQKLKQHLFTHFQTKDLGKLKYFLGIEIAQSSSGVVLSQRKYALDILEETGMLDCKPVDTPMDPNVKLIPGQGEPLGDPGRYRRLVGKLNYLTITRPDISFPVSVVNQFLQSPCDSHWDAVIRILRYIKSTLGQGVLYDNRDHTQVVGYTDANWVGSPTDRRSTSGYCVLLEVT